MAGMATYLASGPHVVLGMCWELCWCGSWNEMLVCRHDSFLLYILVDVVFWMNFNSSPCFARPCDARLLHFRLSLTTTFFNCFVYRRRWCQWKRKCRRTSLGAAFCPSFQKEPWIRRRTRALLTPSVTVCVCVFCFFFLLLLLLLLLFRSLYTRR